MPIFQLYWKWANFHCDEIFSYTLLIITTANSVSSGQPTNSARSLESPSVFLLFQCKMLISKAACLRHRQKSRTPSSSLLFCTRTSSNCCCRCFKEYTIDWQICIIYAVHRRHKTALGENQIKLRISLLLMLLLLRIGGEPGKIDTRHNKKKKTAITAYARDHSSTKDQVYSHRRKITPQKRAKCQIKRVTFLGRNLARTARRTKIWAEPKVRRRLWQNLFNLLAACHKLRASHE